MIVKLNEVVDKISGNEDRFSTNLEYYLAGEHYESERIAIYKRGILRDDINLLGFKFHFPFKAGDTIFMSRNPHLKKAGMVTYDGICSDTSYILRSKDESVLCGKYLPLILQNDRFWTWFEQNKSGSVNYLLNWKTLKEYEFDLPPIDEQLRISSLIWAMENTRLAYEKLIEATDKLINSEFIEMFGDEEKQMRLDSLCDFFGDGDWIEAKDQSTKGIRLIQTGNVGNGEYKDKGDKARYISEETFVRLNCTEVFAGDILISRLPDPIGRACILPQMSRAITAVDCTIVRLKPFMLPEFFVNYTKTHGYTQQIDSFTTGSTRKRVSRANLGSIIVPVPELRRQLQFVTFSQQSEKLKYELTQAIARIDDMSKALMQG